MRKRSTFVYRIYHLTYYTYDAKLLKKAVQRAETGKSVAPTQGSSHERGAKFDQTVEKSPGACSPGKILYLGLLNWLEMHLKLPCAIKFVNLYSFTNDPNF